MTWEKKRVLVTVKAYPQNSKKHGQVVCTVGLTDVGDWIRLYPMPMHLFSGYNKLKKYDWIEVECKKAKEKLNRKESYEITPNSLKIVDRSLSSSSKIDWEIRDELILSHISPSREYLEDMFEEDRTSIGLIKPTELIDFYKKEDLQIYDDASTFQKTLFGSSMIPVVEEIPHIFGYKFKCSGCSDGKPHEIQCEDWELFESYRSWGLKYRDVDVLWDKLYHKFYTYMLESRDLYFYMGMFSIYPTWLIIGLYYPPKNIKSNAKKGKTLFDF